MMAKSSMPSLIIQSIPVASSNLWTASITRGFTVATNIRMRKMSGKEDVTSPVRIMIASTHRPIYPLSSPNTTPNTSVPPNSEVTVMITVVRSP